MSSGPTSEAAILQVPENERCWFHGHEPLPAVFHRLCLECGHCWVTPQELLDAHNRERPPDVPAETDPVQVCFCPLCVHDF